jgi:hypothetical protein
LLVVDSRCRERVDFPKPGRPIGTNINFLILDISFWEKILSTNWYKACSISSRRDESDIWGLKVETF